MEAPRSSLSCAAAAAHDSGEGKEERRTIAAVAVDPFLVEALENPRHRLTVLRMELDIQRFMENTDEQQFEFPHLPTSYLRCAAHRVAQHYGLQTMALDNATDGFGGRVVARKTVDSRYPSTALSDIPTTQAETETPEQVKIVLRQRPNQASMGDATDIGVNRSLLRTVEERKEEYDKARARIFSAPSSPGSDGPCAMHAAEERIPCLNNEEHEYNSTVSSIQDNERVGTKDSASTVAIFRDMEKDRSDPDYDRSYDRYARGFVPSHDFNLRACSVLQPPFMQFEAGFHQAGQFPRAQTSVRYMPSSMMTPHSAIGCNQTSPDAVYMQWPTPAMIYAHSNDPFRRALYSAPVYQQPLGFEQWSNR